MLFYAVFFLCRQLRDEGKKAGKCLLWKIIPIEYLLLLYRGGMPTTEKKKQKNTEISDLRGNVLRHFS